MWINLEKAFLGEKLKKLKVLPNIYLLIVVYFGWVLFKFENMNAMAAVLKGMFGLNNNGIISFETSTVLKSNFVFIIICLIAVLPVIKYASLLIKSISVKSRVAMAAWSVITVVSPAALIFISLINIVGSSYNPFLYFQF